MGVIFAGFTIIQWFLNTFDDRFFFYHGDIDEH